MNYIVTLPLFIGLILNFISSQKIKIKAELLLEKPYEPLPDIIHLNFPKIDVLIPDYLLIFDLFIIIINYYKLNNIEKNILCIGICTIIRAFSVFFTILPSCMPKINYDNSYKNMFLSTHDLMFSGHSLFFIGMGQMLNNNIIQIIGPLSLVLARQHYTIDVCVSGLVYFFIYNII